MKQPLELTYEVTYDATDETGAVRPSVHVLGAFSDAEAIEKTRASVANVGRTASNLKIVGIRPARTVEEEAALEDLFEDWINSLDHKPSDEEIFRAGWNKAEMAQNSLITPPTK